MNNESQVLNIPIEDIIPNRFQPRISFDDDSLQELAASIKEHGIIQPLVLRRLDDKYEIIAGERRYKAARIAGLTSVPAIISMLNDSESAEVAIVENIQRKDLSAIEEAKSYKALLDKGYLTQDELAKKMGLSQSAISNKMRLLSLSDNVQKALMEGKISERHARSLLQVKEKEKQDEWLDRIISERLTVRSLDKKLRENMKEENNINNVDVETVKDDEIPSVPKVPTIDEIRNKATDLFKKDPEPVSPLSNAINSGDKVPNKFFNFLEDEEANMSITETPQPVSSPNINQVEEDIEMLDFLAPDESVNNSNLQDIKNFDKANELVDELISNLNNNGYKASLFKDNSANGTKYTINVE